MKRRRPSDMWPISTLNIRYFDSVMDGYSRRAKGILYLAFLSLTCDDVRRDGRRSVFIFYLLSLPAWQLSDAPLYVFGGGAKWNALYFHGEGHCFVHNIVFYIITQEQASRLVLYCIFIFLYSFQDSTQIIIGIFGIFFLQNTSFTNNGEK